MANPPPGPWQLPVIGSLHHLVSALPHRAMRDLAIRHGPLMLLRVGERPVVVASTEAAAREVMKTHDAAFATRPHTDNIDALTSDGFGIALAPYGEHWRDMRKLCVTELLNARRVRSLQASREAEAAILVSSIASASSPAPESVNMRYFIAKYVADAAMCAIVGDRVGNRDAFLECVEQSNQVAVGFSLADLYPSSRLARAFSGRSRRVDVVIHEMSRLMDVVIEEKRMRMAARGASSEQEDILDVLLRMQADGGLDAPLETSTIRAVLRDLFGPGSEMRNPAALRRAQIEVRSSISVSREGRVREEALPELSYLQLVIKETLRLHPPAPFLLPRECREPCRVLGYDVPVGAMTLVNGWAICRDTSSWGADAEEFRPERFEEGGGSYGMDFRGADFAFVPFGAGRRVCPGITFGLVVMELALASLLFHFDWELPAGSGGQLDMEEVFGLTTARKTDLWLHATLRAPAPLP